jgi:HlyD family secretion protein
MHKQLSCAMKKFISLPIVFRANQRLFDSPEEELSYELGQAVKELPPLYTRLLAASISCIVFGAIAWAALSQVDEVAVAEGKLVPSEQVQPVRSLSGGSIQAIRVKEGQHVKKDDVLVELKSDQIQTEIKNLDQRIAGVRVDIKLIPKDSRKGQATLVRQAQIELDGLSQKLKSAQGKVNRLGILSRQGGIARQDYLDAQDDVDTAKTQIASKQQEIQEIQQKDYAGKSGSTSQLGGLYQTLKQLEGEKQQALHKIKQSTLTAPVTGTIYDLQVTPVQGNVQPGQELLSILPDGGKMILQVNVRNEDIGFIRTEMKARIKLATFPFQEFGTIDGTVNQVSPNGVVNEKSGLIFPTQIKLKKEFVKVRGKDVKFIPGMAATGEIVTRKRSILSFLIEPILQRFDESFSKR